MNPQVARPVKLAKHLTLQDYVRFAGQRRAIISLTVGRWMVDVVFYVGHMRVEKSYRCSEDVPQ